MIGSVLRGRYQVVRPLAEGGMSRLYLGRQLDRDRPVVIKVLDTDKVAKPEFRDLLQREMRLLSQFRHPFAVDLYDAALEPPDPPCLILEYVEGATLAQLLERDGRFRPDRLGRLLGQLCAVLHTGHDRGLLYRDLKPDNVMVTQVGTDRETVKLIDLGLARLSGAAYFALSDFAGAGPGPRLSGTPEYLCPELARGGSMDHRGDLYSVGVSLYELLVGKRPFDRDTIPEMLAAHVYTAPPPFAAFGVTDVPAAVEDVVLWCLAKDPAERPQSARKLAEAYGQALGRKVAVDDADLPPLEELPPSSLRDEPEAAEASDPDAVTYHMTAWMPERIAVIKLKGCLPDIGGEVVDTAPGRLRIRLQRPDHRRVLPSASGGLLGWLGFGKKPGAAPAPGAVHLDLFMRNSDPGKPNQLDLTAVLHPPADRPADDPEWQPFCDHISRELSAYLMARM